MKKILYAGIITAFFALGLLSCESIPVPYSSGRSWYIPETKNAKQTIKLAGISVDRPGNRDSLEREIAVLAPLYFWQNGSTLVVTEGHADYAAHISLREREYTAGWHTRRSISLEVRIWQNDGRPAEDFNAALPIAAGRVVAAGSRSFSSSATTEKMLSRAVKKAAGRLPAIRQGV
jgi:hypothetical protein